MPPGSPTVIDNTLRSVVVLATLLDQSNKILMSFGLDRFRTPCEPQRPGTSDGTAEQFTCHADVDLLSPHVAQRPSDDVDRGLLLWNKIAPRSQRIPGVHLGEKAVKCERHDNLPAGLIDLC